MRKKVLNHKGIKFIVREGTSDEKTFDEVVRRNTYEKKDFKILEGENWIDLGGNVGAFAILALSKGASVEIYEPDPFSCKMIEENLKINGFSANIHNKAVIAGDQKKLTLYVGNNNNVWRNSLYKDWGNQKFTVDCINIKEVIDQKDFCVKMDIEGAEMDILEAMEFFPKKMVFEWSFDIDNSMNRYRKIIDKMKENYPVVMHNKQFYEMADDVLPSHIFPACDNVYCYEEANS